jgi:hypothetical protein
MGPPKRPIAVSTRSTQTKWSGLHTLHVARIGEELGDVFTKHPTLSGANPGRHAFPDAMLCAARICVVVMLPEAEILRTRSDIEDHCSHARYAVCALSYDVVVLTDPPYTIAPVVEMSKYRELPVSETQWLCAKLASSVIRHIVQYANVASPIVELTGSRT